MMEKKFHAELWYFQVAVAKLLGLLGLRLTDSIILPINTTQYALELDDYLKKWVSISSLCVAQMYNAHLSQSGRPRS